jgi:hypothetical protein
MAYLHTGRSFDKAKAEFRREREARKRMRGSRNGENKFENFLENERQLRGELAFLYMPGVFVLLVYFLFYTISYSIP